MWIAFIIVVSVMFGACIGFVALALAVTAKGDADDQRQSDEAQMEFMQRLHQSPPTQWELTHDMHGHHLSFT